MTDIEQAKYVGELLIMVAEYMEKHKVDPKDGPIVFALVQVVLLQALREVQK